MASPVFHGLAGAGLAYALAGDGRLPLSVSLRQSAPLLFAAAVLACLPDVDYLPGIWRGSLNTTHQLATHSLAWAGLVSAGLWLVGRAVRPAVFGRRAAVFLFLLVASHLAIDLFTVDTRAPYGIPLWAPWSARAVRAPFALLPVWSKGSLGDLLQPRNLRPLALEAGLGLAFAAGCGAAKRGWTRRRAAL